MIGQARKRYILGIMTFVVIILTLITAITNISNYINVMERSELRLDFIMRQEGIVIEPEPMPDEKPGESSGEDSGSTGEGDKEDDKTNGVINEETPFDTRFFIVALHKSSKTVVSVDVKRVASVSNEKAIEYARAAFESGSKSGQNKDYNYRAVEKNGVITYVFLDNTREMQSFRAFRTSSILVALAGAVLIFLFLVFFSGVVFKPMINAYEKQKQFITDAGHELKTPLAIIEANTDVLELETGEVEWTKSIRKQSRRLAALTEKLVRLSRMEEIGTMVEGVDFSLSELIEETCISWQTVASSKGKRLAYTVDPDVMLHGDVEQIGELMSILLDNAMKYSSDNASIRLALAKTSHGCELTLENDVESIEKGRLDMLFERFYRRDTSRNAGTGGFGIGLSLAQTIVQNHRGKISAKSDDGKTIIFTITF